MTNILKEYDIDCLYHMTHINNLCSILQYGLLCRNKTVEMNLCINNISDTEVQLRRSIKKINDRPIHDYVPLYFSPRNPMLLSKKSLQDKIIILGINPEVLFEVNTLFSDGNAAAVNTKFYRGIIWIGKLPWEVIKSKEWDLFEEGKRQKCAEVLVDSAVNIDNINTIYCCNKTQKDTISYMIDLEFDIELKVEESLYFLHDDSLS